MLPEAKSLQPSMQWGRREGKQHTAEMGHREQDPSKHRISSVTGWKEARGLCK